MQWPQQNNKSGFELTKDIPYLALTGEQWGVCCDEFTQNLSSYNDIIPYQVYRHSLYEMNSENLVIHQGQLLRFLRTVKMVTTVSAQ